jgi:hypothetical protein
MSETGLASAPARTGLAETFGEGTSLGTHRSRVIACAAALLIAAAVPTILLQHEARASAAASPSAPSRDELGAFASEIETLGVTKYPNSFTEADLEPDGTTDVYIPTAAGQDFISAVRSLNSGNYPVSFIDTQRSYAQLDEINQQVGAASAQLRSEGIFLADSYADASTGTVVVDIQTPNSASISKLASVAGRSVTSSSYPAEVSGVIQGMFGPATTLGKEVTAVAHQDARYDDTAPFFAGDGLVINGGACTGGFNVRNSHGSPFMLSAGHCGSGTVTNNAGTVGVTSSNWYGPNSGYDVQAIAISAGAGVVWLNDSATNTINGSMVPAVGTNITFNGFFTGRKSVKVNRVDFTVSNIWDPHQGFYVSLAHLVEGGDGVNNVCTDGDSGGPVYRPNSSPANSSMAVAIIAFDWLVNGQPQACVGTLMTAILSSKSATLITG